MKFFLVLVTLWAAFQTTDITSDKDAKDTKQSLESVLLDQAKAIYGPSVVKSVTLTTAAHPILEHSGPDHPSARPTPAPSPFEDQKDIEERTQPTSMKGDVATGVILKEIKDVVYLDVTPCQTNDYIYIFHSPFAKKRMNTFMCNGKPIDKYQIAQR